TWGRPRTSTEVPTPASRLICTPVTRCSESVMVTSGSAPMFSAVMLSWMFGASRFRSIARICDARTPETVTVDKVTAAFSFAASALDLAFAALAGNAACASCGAAACAPGLSAWAPGRGDAMAEVATAASSDMEMANDKGCLRWSVDMDFASRLMSVESQLLRVASKPAHPDDVRRATRHGAAVTRCNRRGAARHHRFPVWRSP